jgi:hypothetical protein
MLSYNCKLLVNENYSLLIQLCKNNITVIENELLYIESLLMDSSFLCLSPDDLSYYNNELHLLLENDKKLLQVFTSFLNSIICLALDDLS